MENAPEVEGTSSGESVMSDGLDARDREGENMKQVCVSDWDWLVGKQFSLGDVISVNGNTAIVERGDDRFRVLVCELLEEHDKNNLPIEGFLGDRFRVGAGDTATEGHNAEIRGGEAVPLERRVMPLTGELE